MFSSIQTRVRRVFEPSASEAHYAPLPVDPDASASTDIEPVEATPLRDGHRVAPDVHRSARDVYVCFWLLGAGVLLPWNGKLRAAQRHS